MINIFIIWKDICGFINIKDYKVVFIPHFLCTSLSKFMETPLYLSFNENRLRLSVLGPHSFSVSVAAESCWRKLLHIFERRGYQKLLHLFTTYFRPFFFVFLPTTAPSQSQRDRREREQEPEQVQQRMPTRWCTTATRMPWTRYPWSPPADWTPTRRRMAANSCRTLPPPRRRVANRCEHKKEH